MPPFSTYLLVEKTHNPSPVVTAFSEWFGSHSWWPTAACFESRCFSWNRASKIASPRFPLRFESRSGPHSPPWSSWFPSAVASPVFRRGSIWFRPWTLRRAAPFSWILHFRGLAEVNTAHFLGGCFFTHSFEFTFLHFVAFAQLFSTNRASAFGKHYQLRPFLSILCNNSLIFGLCHTLSKSLIGPFGWLRALSESFFCQLRGAPSISPEPTPSVSWSSSNRQADRFLACTRFEPLAAAF